MVSKNPLTTGTATDHCSMAIRPLLLGHRGARGEKSIPENTLASFDLALAQGCDGFEFDVRLSADGQAVICHDAKTRGLKIAESFRRAVGLALVARSLTRYRSTAFLDIELKVAGLETITADLLRQHCSGYAASWFRRFFPKCSKPSTRMDATIPLGLICETRVEFSPLASVAGGVRDSALQASLSGSLSMRSKPQARRYWYGR